MIMLVLSNQQDGVAINSAEEDSGRGRPGERG